MSDQKRVVKVAVVGSGLAGLTTALLLTSANVHSDANGVHFDVHLFEKASAVGMDAHSVTVPVDGEKIRIDVPMRSFQGGYYPNLLAFYTYLGVQFREANFSYSFARLAFTSKDRSTLSLRPHFIYEGRTGRNGLGIPTSVWSDSDLWRLKSSRLFFTRVLRTATATFPQLFDYVVLLLITLMFFVRLNVLCIPMIWNHESRETLAEWTTRSTPSSSLSRTLGLDTRWKSFVQDVLVPLFSCVCTAPEEDVYRHPVNEMLEYCLLTLFTSHYRVTNGVSDAVQRITQSIPASNIHLSSNISSIEPDSLESPTLGICFITESGLSELISGFKHVIMATQANQAIPLLSTLQSSYPQKSIHRSSIEAQIDCLSKFKYVPNIVVNHTDTTFLPEREADHRDLNIVMGTKSQSFFASDKTHWDGIPCLPTGYAMATHLIRRPNISKTKSSSLSRADTIMQTTDPIYPPAPSSILSIARMERAVLTPESKSAQRDLMSVGSGRWVFSWRGFSSSWRPFTIDYYRSHALGRLQGPMVRTGGDIEDTGRTEGFKGAHRADGPGVWLCGSYAHPGIPLLEACVNSALNVVENGVFAVEGVDVKAEWAVRA